MVLTRLSQSPFHEAHGLVAGPEDAWLAAPAAISSTSWCAPAHVASRWSRLVFSGGAPVVALRAFLGAGEYYFWFIAWTAMNIQSMAKLARLLDPRELDDHPGSIGRFAIEIPRAWRGHTVQIVAPRRITCSRCDGGGCDSCARSGAFRLDGNDEDRTFDVVIPDRDHALLRIVRPLGDDGPLDLLLLEARQAKEPSDCVRAPTGVMVAGERAGATPLGIVLALALVTVLAYLMIR